jgi:CBS domain-containing protein
MKKVSQLILQKGNTVTTIQANKTVFDAIEIMAAKNIGALMVYQDDVFVGVLTERDYTHKVILKGRHSHDTLVSEIMQSQPSTVAFNDSIEKCMEVMSEKRIRYLPVLADSHVVALVSMGDLVRFIIEDQKHTIQNLQNYISGNV